MSAQTEGKGGTMGAVGGSTIKSLGGEIGRKGATRGATTGATGITGTARTSGTTTGATMGLDPIRMSITGGRITRRQLYERR